MINNFKGGDSILSSFPFFLAYLLCSLNNNFPPPFEMFVIITKMIMLVLAEAISLIKLC